MKNEVKNDIEKNKHSSMETTFLEIVGKFIDEDAKIISISMTKIDSFEFSVGLNIDEDRISIFSCKSSKIESHKFKKQ